MDVFRDSIWQGVGAVTSIIALFLYIYVEREKIFPQQRKGASTDLGSKKASQSISPEYSQSLSTTSRTRKRLNKYILLLLWTIVTTATSFMSVAITFWIFPSGTGVLERAIKGCMLGLILGFGQWLFMRQYYVSFLRWTGLTVILFILSTELFYGSAWVLLPVPVSLVLGIILITI